MENTLNYCTVSQTVCGGFQFLHIHANMNFAFLYIINIAILVGVRLTHIFLMIWCQISFHVFINYMCFFGEMSIQIIAHFQTGLFVFLLLTCKTFYICVEVPHQIHSLYIFSSHSVGFSIYFFMVSFEAQKFLIQIKCNVPIFSFAACAFSIVFIKPYLTQSYKDLLLYFILRVYSLSFYIYIFAPFWVTFCIWC